MSPSSFESVACPRCGFPELAPQIVIVDPTSTSPEYLHSNYLPPDSVIVCTRREIAVAETGIAHVEEKMADLERVINQLRLRRQSLRDFITNHRRVLAPIRRLPTELLSEIFSHCVQRDAYEWDPTRNMEWILVQVSRAWRAVSISIPQIWSCISISDASAPKNIDLKAALSLQLERSAHCPLTVDLHLDFRFCSSERRMSVLEPLFSARDRWQSVNIHLTEAEFLHFRSDTSFPKLTKLGLGINSSKDECAFDSIFQATPALQELHYNVTSLSQIQCFPLSQLRRLDLWNVTYDSSDLSSVLGLACNILELQLRECIPLDAVEVNPKTLPNLVSLSVAECDDTLLGYIIAPVLRRLAISFFPNARLSDDLVSFMTRTGPSLTDLTFRHAPARGDRLELLALAPHLTSLSMGPMSTLIGFDFIKGLTCGLGERNLVPHAVSLEFTGIFENGHYDSLLAMLTSRCISGPLRSARISGAKRLADMQQQLLVLGLNLVDSRKKS
ncbi:hypothetical protein B0H16DRAFT_1636919 [Mycena metata]|uniref:F-box domain-containing protein n=1 Tax=Mycena metata TaxID=1033252 RepID=A0AAD7M7D3_9AGAR|nr:hypothetical protein B0H16DRAFT_1636919 [Mycena metata]